MVTVRYNYILWIGALIENSFWLDQTHSASNLKGDRLDGEKRERMIYLVDIGTGASCSSKSFIKFGSPKDLTNICRYLSVVGVCDTFELGFCGI